jgi:hypothetical protein
MPFSDNIEYLMAHPGTVAVLVQPLGAAPMRAGIDTWQDVLNHALLMMYTSRETFVSAVVGEHSILAETRDGQQCAVVYPTGHAASKVMRRMLRHAAGPKRTMRKVESRTTKPKAVA